MRGSLRGRPSVQLASAAFAYEPPFLLALEQAIWTELVQCLRLSKRLEAQRREASVTQGEAVSTAVDDGVAAAQHIAQPSVTLPEQLLALIPPPPRQGWPVGMPEPPSSAEWLRRWGYPPVRRAQRLSFLIAAGLPALLGISSATAAAASSAASPHAPSSREAETDGSTAASVSYAAALDRQKLLQAGSVRERLQVTVVYLNQRRQRLAAMATLGATIGRDGSGDQPEFDV